jgi:flagellar basal-body rod protein FlgB
MAISDLPIFSLLRTKMQWHQERQRLLAENVANANTPGFRPRDLAPMQTDGPGRVNGASLTLARTDGSHMNAGGASGSAFAFDRAGRNQVRPTGNAVNLEDEMLKVGANQMDYQLVTSLYTHSLGLIKSALGKK